MTIRRYEMVARAFLFFNRSRLFTITFTCFTSSFEPHSKFLKPVSMTVFISWKRNKEIALCRSPRQKSIGPFKDQLNVLTTFKRFRVRVAHIHTHKHTHTHTHAHTHKHTQTHKHTPHTTHTYAHTSTHRHTFPHSLWMLSDPKTHTLIWFP